MPASPGRHDHQVDLGPAHELHGRLVAAAVHHAIDPTEVREPIHERARRRGLGEDVEVADRLAPAPEGSRGLEPGDAVDRAQLVHDRLDDLACAAEQQSPRLRLERLDSRQDRRLGPLREPADRAQVTSLGRVAEVFEILDAEVLVQLPHRSRPDAGTRSSSTSAGGTSSRRRS